MIIAIDFDGTCVTHEFPNVGKDIGAVQVLKQLVERGDKLILFTMRSNDIAETENGLEQKNYLSDAVEWFKKNKIDLYGVQRNPTQYLWTTSPKVYAQMYIDDAALGCPLKYDKEYSERPFVDWKSVAEILKLNYDDKINQKPTV